MDVTVVMAERAYFSTLTQQKIVDLGDTVSAGDVLLEIETDKAGMDVEAVEDGILAKILASAFRVFQDVQQENNTIQSGRAKHGGLTLILNYSSPMAPRSLSTRPLPCWLRRAMICPRSRSPRRLRPRPLLPLRRRRKRPQVRNTGSERVWVEDRWIMGMSSIRTRM